MTTYYAILAFIFGTCFGSFFNVVGYRLPRRMSIVKPNSHCTSCNHELKIKDLFPILSYICLKGKCRYCKSHVGLFYPIFETLTGLLFMICYLKFKISIEFAISIIFISMSLIVMISDWQTMIIPDSILVIPGILVLILTWISKGFLGMLSSLLNGVIAFIIMYILKIIGDALFKKESMGGGDIKLMGVFGLFLGWPNAILSLFFSSFIGLPISFFLVAKKDSHEIPFGPFLVIAAMIIMISGIDMDFVIKVMSK